MDDDIRVEMERLKERNRRVEADKAWELSWTRKIIIVLFTYLFAVIVLASINAPSPLLTGSYPRSHSCFPLRRSTCSRDGG